MMGAYVDQSKPYKKTSECHECGEKFKKGEAKQVVEIYDDPWATKPRTVAVHADNDNDGGGTCLDKLTDTSWSDFRYQVCPVCGRMVIMQCLSNGWRSYFKELNGEEVCIRCYQEDILADGHGAEPFEGGKIPGDFFNATQLSANGWAPVPGFGDRHITGGDSVKRFCAEALLMIKNGYKVLVDYDMMGIGGGEGFVSLYAKEENHG